jgi:hypothetical protein
MLSSIMWTISELITSFGLQLPVFRQRNKAKLRHERTTIAMTKLMPMAKRDEESLLPLLYARIDTHGLLAAVCAWDQVACLLWD